jgi:hypothetical protein
MTGENERHVLPVDPPQPAPGGASLPEASSAGGSAERQEGGGSSRPGHSARPRSERDVVSVEDGSLRPLARALLALAEQLRGEEKV